MATFQFTTKDGRTFEFDAPDPLTAASMWNKAQAQLAGAPAAPKQEPAGTPTPLSLFANIKAAPGGPIPPGGDRTGQADYPPPNEWESAAKGFADTAALGWGDELTAAVSSGMGLWGDYEKNLAAIRAAQERAQQANPEWYTGGQVGGAVGTAFVPGLNVARGAGLVGRMGAGAATGAGYGAAYGAGSANGSAADRVGGAVTSGLVGGVGGAAGTAAVEAATAAWRAIAPRVAAPMRGLIAPEREAQRRVGVAMNADNAINQPRLTPQEEWAAIRNGQPVYNIDRGGETTRALGRSAANTSPQARAALDNVITDRYTGQGDRTVATVRTIAGTGTTFDARARLIADAAAANRPAYLRAYADPRAQSVWDDGLEQLAGAPVVQDAIRQATITGRNQGALNGFPPVRNPFVADPATGRLSLATDAQGNRVVPNLQFWDHVKRNLDAVGTPDARQAARVLREHLDQVVPSYNTARAGAAQAFDAQDALEAGDQFLSSRMANDEARDALAHMSPAERRLFAEGFADALTRRVQESGDNRNVINSLFLTSAASRERIGLALGQQRANELEAFLRVEAYLDRARVAIQGNSTTARQLTELGLASGAGLAVSGGNVTDPRFLLTAALVRGGRAGFRGIDVRVAQRVGELLASDDPALVQQGVQMIAQNTALFQAVRGLGVVPAAAVGSETAVNQARPRSPVFNVPPLPSQIR